MHTHRSGPVDVIHFRVEELFRDNSRRFIKYLQAGDGFCRDREGNKENEGEKKVHDYTPSG